MRHRYLIALGSNVRHHRHGRPDQILRAALLALKGEGVELEAASPLIASPPLGPSRRRYANAVAVVTSEAGPPELLAALKRIERAFGRRERGQRWSARVLDLDVILWSGGSWGSPELVVPHVAFRDRSFVLRPALAIAGHWRDPITALSLRHLAARLTRPRPLPIGVPQGALSSVGRATDF